MSQLSYQALGARQVTENYQVLTTLADSFKPLFSDVELLLKTEDLLGIIAKDTDFAYYSEEIERYEYLSTLSAEDLYNRYYQAFLGDCSNPLINFNQEHRDLFNSLRFRAMIKQIHQMS